jgi:chorismate mutase
MDGPMSVHAIRGATQVEADERDLIIEATTELVAEVMARNVLTNEEIISVIFTATPDLSAEFPALAARKAGLHDVPLLCTTEIDVPLALPRIVRLLAHVDVPRPRSEIKHVYLRGARALRPDLAPGQPEPPGQASSGAVQRFSTRASFQ